MSQAELEHQIQQIEVGFEEAKEVIALRDALIRLQTNEDFKKVINENYLRDEALRLSSLLDEPNIPEGKEKFVLADLRGIAALKRHFASVFRMATMAENAMEEDKNTLSELQDELGAMHGEQ